LSANRLDTATGRIKSNHQTTGLQLYNIPIVINGQVSMTGNSISKGEKLIVRYNVLHNRHKDCKILLLSDGHGRGCAERLKNQLPSNSEVSGFVNSGALSSILMNTAVEGVRKFTSKDFLVIWYGSNDVNSNNAATGVKNILQFVMNNLDGK
jgi:hypothetical protein